MNFDPSKNYDGGVFVSGLHNQYTTEEDCVGMTTIQRAIEFGRLSDKASILKAVKLFHAQVDRFIPETYQHLIQIITPLTADEGGCRIKWFYRGRPTVRSKVINNEGETN